MKTFLDENNTNNFQFIIKKNKEFKIEDPTISIITVVYNGENNIEETIKSVINQTYKNIEYLIIDGKSGDETLNIVNKYADYIHVIISEFDNGIYDAMNKGLKLATGDYVYFLNCGDMILEPNTFEKISLQIGENPDKKFFYSDILKFNPANGKSYIEECSHERCILNHQASIYKKELHSIFGQYYSNRKLLISDYIFFSLIPVGNFYKSSHIIAKYDLSGVSMSGDSPIQSALFNYLIGKISFSNMILRVFTFKLFFNTLVKIKNYQNRRKTRYIRMKF